MFEHMITELKDTEVKTDRILRRNRDSKNPLSIICRTSKQKISKGMED